MDKNVKASREIIRLDTVNRPLNNICKIYINSNILPFNPENLLAVYTESNCVFMFCLQLSQQAELTRPLCFDLN